MLMCMGSELCCGVVATLSMADRVYDRPYLPCSVLPACINCEVHDQYWICMEASTDDVNSKLPVGIHEQSYSVP